jgi:hypothetical protein
MSRVQVIVGMAAVVVSLGCASGEDDPAPAVIEDDRARRRAEITVQVDAPDGTPLAGAPVAFHDASGRLVLETTSDDAGRAYGRLGGERGAVSVGRVLPSGERELTTFLDARRFDVLTVRTPAPDPPGHRQPAPRAGVTHTQVLFPAARAGALRYVVATTCGHGSVAAVDAGDRPAVVVEHHAGSCSTAGRSLAFVGAAVDAAGQPLAFASGRATLGAAPAELGAFEPAEETTLHVTAHAGDGGAWLQETVRVDVEGEVVPAPFWRHQQWTVGPVPPTVRFRLPASKLAAARYRVALLGSSTEETYPGWYLFAIQSSWEGATPGAVELLPLVERLRVERDGGAPVIEWQAVTPVGVLDAARITVDWEDGGRYHVWNVLTRGTVVPERVAPPQPSPGLRDFGLSDTARWLELRWLRFEAAAPGGVRVSFWNRDSV